MGGGPADGAEEAGAGVAALPGLVYAGGGGGEAVGAGAAYGVAATETLRLHEDLEADGAGPRLLRLAPLTQPAHAQNNWVNFRRSAEKKVIVSSKDSQRFPNLIHWSYFMRMD